MREREKKKRQTFHISQVFLSLKRGRKFFSSDLLALHEMHIVIKFGWGAKLQFTLKGKEKTFRSTRKSKLP